MQLLIRPPGRAPYTVTLDRLTALVRAAREIRMAISRDDLKKKRLQAMGVVGAQMAASADMFDRVIAAGEKVTVARTAAETAQMGAIDAQVADLNEMAEEMAEFTNGTPTPGGTSGTASPTIAAAPASVTGATVGVSEALKVLNAAQPNPSAAWVKGDAYLGTHGENRNAQGAPFVAKS